MDAALDLFVIGTEPGGLAAGRLAKAQGESFSIIEKGKPEMTTSPS